MSFDPLQTLDLPAFIAKCPFCESEGLPKDLCKHCKKLHDYKVEEDELVVRKAFCPHGCGYSTTQECNFTDHVEDCGELYEVDDLDDYFAAGSPACNNLEERVAAGQFRRPDAPVRPPDNVLGALGIRDPGSGSLVMSFCHGCDTFIAPDEAWAHMVVHGVQGEEEANDAGTGLPDEDDLETYENPLYDTTAFTHLSVNSDFLEVCLRPDANLSSRWDSPAFQAGVEHHLQPSVCRVCAQLQSTEWLPSLTPETCSFRCETCHAMLCQHHSQLLRGCPLCRSAQRGLLFSGGYHHCPGVYTARELRQGTTLHAAFLPFDRDTIHPLYDIIFDNHVVNLHHLLHPIGRARSSRPELANVHLSIKPISHRGVAGVFLEFKMLCNVHRCSELVVDRMVVDARQFFSAADAALLKETIYVNMDDALHERIQDLGNSDDLSDFKVVNEYSDSDAEAPVERLDEEYGRIYDSDGEAQGDKEDGWLVEGLDGVRLNVHLNALNAADEDQSNEIPNMESLSEFLDLESPTLFNQLLPLVSSLCHPSPLSIIHELRFTRQQLITLILGSNLSDEACVSALSHALHFHGTELGTEDDDDSACHIVLACIFDLIRRYKFLPRVGAPFNAERSLLAATYEPLIGAHMLRPVSPQACFANMFMPRVGTIQTAEMLASRLPPAPAPAPTPACPLFSPCFSTPRTLVDLVGTLLPSSIAHQYDHQRTITRDECDTFSVVVQTVKSVFAEISRNAANE